MSPIEFSQVCELIAEVSKKAYLLGFADSVARKPKNVEQFILGKKSRLLLKTMLEKERRK